MFLSNRTHEMWRTNVRTVYEPLITASDLHYFQYGNVVEVRFLWHYVLEFNMLFNTARQTQRSNNHVGISDRDSNLWSELSPDSWRFMAVIRFKKSTGFFSCLIWVGHSIVRNKNISYCSIRHRSELWRNSNEKNQERSTNCTRWNNAHNKSSH